jgi:hypothetical protein
MATSSEYKKLIEGFLGGLLLAAGRGGNSKISNMLPSKNKSDFTHSLNFSYSNQGYVPNSVSQWLYMDKANQTPNATEATFGFDANGSETESPVSSMINSSGGTTPANNETKWVFVANPMCCEKCLALNGHVETSPTEPKFYGHVPNREGRYNCKCHWLRLK